MILKQEKNTKGKWLIFGGLLSVFCLSILTIDFNSFDQYKHDVSEKLMSQNLGFSKTGTPRAFVNKFVRQFPEIVKGNILGFENRPKIDKIYIDIKFDHVQTILNDRKKGLEYGVLKESTKVPAKLRYNGKVYKAKIRLKGDLADHWTASRRMSLRVSLSGKNSIFGYKSFSIHKPRARQHPHDQIYQAIRQVAGGLSSNHTYAYIYVNGERWGIMNIEEHMSKELLEKSAAKESLIFRFGSDDDWYYTRGTGQKESNVPGYRIGDNILNTRIYDSSKYLEDAEDDLYRKWYSYIIGKRLQSNSPEIYDIDKFSRGVILARIWNNNHTLAHTNSRYYLNPYTLKLEPITTDQGIASDINVEEKFLAENYTFYDMYQDVLTHVDYETGFEENYKDISKVLSASKPIFQRYHDFFPLDSEPNFAIILNNLRMVDAHREEYFQFPKKSNFANNEISKKLKHDKIEVLPEQAEALMAHVHALHYTDGRIEIYNLMPADLDVIDIRVDGVSIDDPYSKVIPAYQEVSHRPQSIIQTSLKDIQDGRITIISSVQNHHREYTIPVTLMADDLFNPLLEDNAATFDYLVTSQPGKWRMNVGKWAVERPIYVHGDLHIDEGTELTFAKNAYMIVHGDLTVTGTAKAKVIFQPKDKDLGWKGLYVIGGEKGSELTHINIKNTQALEDGLLRLTGGTTFYNTRVALKYTKFLGTQAEDALNLVHTNFEINKITISDARSDGFDGDFSNGNVDNSFFHHIGGDALDYSGSKVIITNPRIDNVKDKAISVGEASIVTVLGGEINNVGVAIASKDGSSAQVSNLSIRDVKLSPAMTYIKKPFYGTPSLVISDSDIVSTSTFFRQVGTRLVVNNRVIATQNIDVDTLYQSGVMKK